MKHKVLFIVIMALSGIMGSVRPAMASHLLGCSIGWTYLGNDTFNIYVDVYRDCNGVPMQEQPFTVFPCGQGQGTYVTTLISAGMDITPLCKNNCSRCSDATCSFGQGIEQYRFSAKMNLRALDSNCCQFDIVWVACCEANSITTGAQGEEFYVDAMVDRCLAPHDNSPAFATQPVMIFNVGQCQTLNFACTDPDIDANGFQDSLVYAIDPPLQGAGSPVNFIAPYAYNHPLIYTGTSINDAWNPPLNCNGFHIDSTNGTVMFRSNKTDVSTMSVLVQEYGKNANGKSVLKGYTHRQINLFPMKTEPDNVPVLSGINGTDTTSLTICYGDSACFYIDATDPDANDSVKVTAVLPPPMSGAVVASGINVQHPRTIICWKPIATDAGKTYQFNLNAADDACPVNGRTSKVYTIRISKLVSIKPNINSSPPVCGLFGFSASTSVQQLKYLWTGDDGLYDTSVSFTHHYRYPGTYRYHLIATNALGCSDTSGGVLIVPEYIHATLHPKDTLFCGSGIINIRLEAQISGSTGTPYVQTWRTEKYTAISNNDSINVPVNSDTFFIITMKDPGSGCQNQDTVKIKISHSNTPVKLVPQPPVRFCAGQTVSLQAIAHGGDSANYRFVWKDSLNHVLPGDGASLFLQPASSQSVLLTVTDGCTSDSSYIRLNMNQPLHVLVVPVSPICRGWFITLRAVASGGNAGHYSYSWGVGQDTGSTIRIDPDSDQVFRVTATDGCSAPATYAIHVPVYQLPSSSFYATPLTAVEFQNIQFYNTSKNAIEYTWNFGDGSSSYADSPAHAYTDTGYYTVTLTSMAIGGCTDSAARKKYIHILPEFTVYIPNGFTPNNDTLNDCFEPVGQAIRSYSLQIFTRYGNTVYKGNTCWDGTFKGQPLMEGMYIYHLMVTATDGSMHSYSGPVYLLIPN